MTLLIFALVSTAQSRAPTREIKMKPLSRLSADERARIRAASDASFHLRLDPGIDCTGTFISDSGHVLTALHCVAGCLAKNAALVRTHASPEPVAIRGEEKIFLDKMTVNQDRVDQGVSCPAWINDKKLSARIILIGGKGWLTLKEEVASFARANPDDYRFLLDHGYEHSYDFAILKVDGVSENKNNACLPMAESAPRAEEVLNAISYACVFRDDFDSDGKTPLYTRGERTSGLKASDYYKNRAPSSLPLGPDLIERQDTFFSSLDIEKCGSGSGIFDSRSRLVGVATRVYKTSTDYEFGSLEAIDIARVWKELYEKKSGSEIKEITACPKPRALLSLRK